MDDHLAISTSTPDLRVGELVDHLPAPVAVHRPGGEIIYANDAMASLAGFPGPSALLGRHLTELVHPDDLVESLALVAGSTPEGNRWTSLRLLVADGTSAHVDIHQIPLLVGDAPAALSLFADVTDRVGAEAALRDSEARFRALIHNATDMVVVHLDGNFTYVSPAVTRVLGWPAADLLGRPVASIVHDDDLPMLRERTAERQRGVVATSVGRYRLRCKDGSWRTVETTSAPSNDPAVDGVIVNARDVTESVEAAEALRRSEARHRALVEHLSDVIVVADESGRIGYVSPGIVRVIGWPAEDVIGETIFNAIHPEDHPRGREQLERAVAGGPGVYGPERFRYLRADGQWRHLEATGSNRLADPDVGGVVFVLRDVTDQVEAQEQLRHLALHDPLTGLANRTLLTERLETALAASRRDGRQVALLVLDLDGFKAINDRHGHDAGDALLVTLTARLASGVREIDTVARLGGDEFAAVLPAVDDAPGVAQRLLEVLQDPVVHEGDEIAVGASIGVAVTDGAEAIPELFRRADRAMYQAKAGGLGVVVG